MKICAIICEFNPFHNGHKYLLERARELSGCDAVLCIMSGSFTQRGDVCVLDKYVRAGHAVRGGADAVVQLPAAFAVSPAEVFAKGAVKILSSVPDITTLAFGCENAERDFFGAAKILIDESGLFKTVLNEKLAQGESYIKSYAAAFAACGGDGELVSNPNNILGTEYARALLGSGADIGILPIKRQGPGYNDCALRDNFSSASAIRRNLGNPLVADNLPDYVYGDLKSAYGASEYENMARHCLFTADGAKLKKIYGCGEGLENKLKSLENEPFDRIIERATSRRYSSSRIRRILCANLLGLYADDSERFLQADLYIKTLAVRKESADGVLSALSKSVYPVITGAEDGRLGGAAKQCFEKDRYEYAVYNHIVGADVTRKGFGHMVIV